MRVPGGCGSSSRPSGKTSITCSVDCGHFRELDDERIDLVLSFHGLKADDLRGCTCMVARRLPGCWTARSVPTDLRIRDMVERLRSGKQVEDAFALQGAQRLPGAGGLPDQALAEVAWKARRELLQDLYEHMPNGENLASTMLRRVFPSLHWRAAQGLVDAATTTDRQRLLDSGRVPLQLAESSRAYVQNMRVTRVYEALHWTRRKTLMWPGSPSACCAICPVLPRVSAGVCSRAVRAASCSLRASRGPPPAI